jgi:DNA-binding SARP family transcriptional activator
VVFERERFHQLRIHALESLCDQLAASRRYVQAEQAGLAAISGEPLRESAHRALIRVYLREGNRGEAIRQYGWAKRRASLGERVRLPSTAGPGMSSGVPCKGGR